ncbi:MAG: glycosyltransferase family 2 protein [Acidimicrobiales bacterium]|nr:glycosyltransferase family 2 protein [Acidimicrobiales bacterium]
MSYRPGTWLRPCLQSVVDQAYEVIVVDNGSAGAQATAIARECGARPVRSEKNLGFAGGFNAGVAQARGDLVAVLNDDATAGPTWIESASRRLADAGVAAVTPKVLLSGWFLEARLEGETWFAPGDARPLGRQVRSVTVDGVEVLDRAVGAGLHDLEQSEQDGRWRWTAGPKPFYLPLPDGSERAEVRVDGEPVEPGPVVRVVNHAGSYLRDHGVAGEYGVGAPDDGRFDVPAERFGFSATAPVFRAEILRRLGGFADPFFAYNEDTDWCLRARLAGLRIMYDPGATVSHRLSTTSGGAAEVKVQRLAQRNALLCLIRNGPARVARREVQARLARPWGDPVKRELVRLFPWAVGSRMALSRRWILKPAEVWERWAEQDMQWDQSPAVTL